MNKWSVGLLLVIILVVFPPPASAHVLVRDETNNVGAVLHITPDDDPVAGEQSSILFTVQGRLDESRGPVLTVIDAGGSQTRLSQTQAGSAVGAKHIFPAQGVYTLRLSVLVDGSERVFVIPQRVSRGAQMAPADAMPNVWAENLLIVSGSSALVLSIIGFNRRREIAAHSKR